MKFSSLYTHVTTAFQALQFVRLSGVILLNILLVQMSFSAKEISHFEWILFLSNAVSFFWAQGLRNALMSFYPKQSDSNQKKLFFSISLFFLGISILASLVLMTLDYLGLISTSGYLYYLILFILFNIPSSLIEHILILKNKATSLFLYGLLFYGGYFLLLGYYGLKFLEIKYVIYALVLWASIKFIYLIYLIMRYSKINLDLSFMMKFLLFGFPLIIHVLVGGGMEYVDGFLVRYFFEESDFTYFRYGVRELPINTIFISSLVTATIPFAVINLSQSLVDVKRRLSRLMNWLFPLSMILIWISPIVYTFLYNETYLLSARIFNVYLLIICSRILLPQLLIYAKHDNKVFVWIGVMELIINLVLSLIFLSFFGIMGLALATVIAYMIQKILLIRHVNINYDIALSTYLDTRKYYIFSILLYLCFIASEALIYYDIYSF